VPRKCDGDINTICKLGKVKEWMAAGGRGANGGMFWYRLHHTKVHTNDPHEVKMICDMCVCSGADAMGRAGDGGVRCVCGCVLSFTV
jgi:hypothetical protein